MMTQVAMIDTVVRCMASSRPMFRVRIRDALKSLPLIDHREFEKAATTMNSHLLDAAVTRWSVFARQMSRAELEGTTRQGKRDAVWDATPDDLRTSVLCISEMFGDVSAFPSYGWTDDVSSLADIPDIADVYRGIQHSFDTFNIPEFNRRYRVASCAVMAKHVYPSVPEAIQTVNDSFELVATVGSGTYIPELVTPLLDEWVVPHIKGMYVSWEEHTYVYANRMMF